MVKTQRPNISYLLAMQKLVSHGLLYIFSHIHSIRETHRHHKTKPYVVPSPHQELDIYDTLSQALKNSPAQAKKLCGSWFNFDGF